jgi:hypothetical protein
MYDFARSDDHDDDTCPHLVRANLLEAENARLKAEVERLRHRCQALREAGDDLWYCIRHRDFDPDATETWQEVRADLKADQP